MKNISYRLSVVGCRCVALCLALLLLSAVSSAQRRDHLTEQEADLVREAQELDRRTEIFIKAIERRFLILNNRQADLKDAEKWGEPKGSKAQMLYDVSKILQSAIDNVEDVAARDPNSKLFPKAMNNLVDASRKFLPQLEAYKVQLKDKMEEAAILTSIDYCRQIIEAAVKVPKETPKEEKKKKSAKNDSN